MAKYSEISSENKELLNEILDQTSIPQWVVIEALNNDRQKEIYRINKANDILETLTNGVNFVIILNESIFDQLTEEHQKMILIECLSGIIYDSEKDTLSLNKPDFTTYSGVLQKYGHEEIISLKESVKSLFDEKQQQEDEEKAARKKKS